MKDYLITILTPSYNRAPLLQECYESLKKQTNMNYIWLIVDDGSTDNTQKVVEAFIDEGLIPVKYVKKDNGGKHTAINYGVQYVTSILTLILDSDDKLSENATDVIQHLYNQYKEYESICGFSLLKSYSDGKVMSDFFPTEGRYNVIDWRVNYIVSGELCDVFYTNILKKYPFSVYPGEKFIGESTAWIRMAEKYDMIGVNIPIYIADYLEGGLTKEGRSMRLKCPYGGMEYANLCMGPKCCIKRRIKSSLLYNAYARIGGLSLKESIHKSNSKLLTVLMLIPSYLLILKWTRITSIRKNKSGDTR